MVEGKSRVEIERLEASRMKAMEAARVRVRTGSWQTWRNLAVAAVIVGLPLATGRIAFALGIPAGVLLATYAAWFCLADAEVSFDADGLLVTDRLWQLLRRKPILFRYADGIQIVYAEGIQILSQSGVVWVNGLRIPVGDRAADRMEKAVKNMGLSFTRLDASIATIGPIVLMLAAIPALLLIHGVVGWLLYYLLYGSGILAVLVPSIAGHLNWGAIATRQGSH